MYINEVHLEVILGLAAASLSCTSWLNLTHIPSCIWHASPEAATTGMISMHTTTQAVLAKCRTASSLSFGVSMYKQDSYNVTTDSRTTSTDSQAATSAPATMCSLAAPPWQTGSARPTALPHQQQPLLALMRRASLVLDQEHLLPCMHPSTYITA